MAPLISRNEQPNLRSIIASSEECGGVVIEKISSK